MINASELMVGNWVQFISTGDYEQVEDIQTHEQNPAVNRVDVGDIVPIPITPEILERIGFLKTENRYASCGFYYTLEYTHDPKPGHFLEKVKLVSQTGIDVEIVGLNWVKCIFVHQLQNLYFVLTGEPLQIKFTTKNREEFK
jgi:hypothetical protein